VEIKVMAVVAVVAVVAVLTVVTLAVMVGGGNGCGDGAAEIGGDDSDSWSRRWYWPTIIMATVAGALKEG
jgi:hypothetical protein